MHSAVRHPLRRVLRLSALCLALAGGGAGAQETLEVRLQAPDEVRALLERHVRLLRREALEKDWDTAPQAEGPAARDRFIEAGMADYEHSLRRKLLWGVLVLPAVVIGLLIYLVNYA